MNTKAINEIYLSQLSLSGFRTYGARTEITLPAGPSLTVIVGPNGLGKSTLFDAIEWGMTGALKRINNIDARQNEKLRSIGVDPQVKLLFGDSTEILRTGRDAQVRFNDVLAAQSHIDNWLVADAAWGGMTDIADCLHFTHFLGQSTKQLFVHQEGKERWSRMEGPSGLQTLWAMEQKLGRRQTTVGFDDLAEKLQLHISQASEELEKFKKIMDDLGLQRELARSDAAISPEEIEAGISEIQQLLHQYFKAENLVVQFESGEIRLEQQQMLMEQVKDDLAKKLKQLDEWPTLAQTFITYSADIASHTKALALAKENATHAGELLQTAQASEASLRQERDVIQNQINERLTETGKLNQAVLQRNEIAKINEENLQIDTTLEELKKGLTELSQIIVEKNVVLNGLKEQKKQYGALHASKRDLEEIQRNVVTLQTQQMQHQAALSQANQLAESEPDLIRKHDETKQELKALAQELLGLDQQWQQAKVSADTIAQAVVQIAGALRNEDCSCPVCQSSFLEGELKALANSSAVLVNGQLSQIETLRQSKLPRQNQLRLALEEIERQQKAILEAHAAVRLAAGQAQSLEQDLRAKPFLTLIAVDQFADICRERLAELNEAIAAAEMEIAQTDDVTVLESTIANLESDKNSVAQQSIAMTQKRDAATLRSGQLQKSLAIFSEQELADMDQRLTALSVTNEQAQTSLLEKNKIVDAALEASANQKAKHAILEAEAAKYESSLRSIDKLQQGLQKRWQDLDYPGDPTPERVAEACRDQAEQQIRLHGLQLRHGRLLEGQRRYSAQTSVQRIEKEKSQFLSKYPGKSEQEVKDFLNNRVNEERAAQEKLKQVRAKRDEMVAAMRKNNTSIRDGIATPLNKSVARFCKALMADRDLKVEVDTIASASTAQALLSFQSDDSEAKKNPQLYLSEGQLAAVSLCLLFGAATTYPWSRWKALLLDDPLHHNDTIHSAAFVDVIRNLIKYQGYQIVVSTHDMEQAGYFLRKCANAGIDTQYWNLYGRSDNGVLMEGKSIQGVMA